MNAEALTSTVVDFGLKAAGVNIPKDVTSAIVEAGRAMMKDRGYVNLKQLFDDTEFQSLVATVQKDLPQYLANSNVVNEGESETLVRDVSQEAVIKCPHCALPFMVGDAIPKNHS